MKNIFCFWLPEVDFWLYILTSRSQLSVIYFDFRKSTFCNIFWLSEVDFRLYILTFGSWLPIIYLTSRSRLSVIYFNFQKYFSREVDIWNNFGDVIYVASLKCSKANFGIFENFGGAEKNTWRCRKKASWYVGHTWSWWKKQWRFENWLKKGWWKMIRPRGGLLKL